MSFVSIVLKHCEINSQKYIYIYILSEVNVIENCIKQIWNKRSLTSLYGFYQAVSIAQLLIGLTKKLSMYMYCGIFVSSAYRLKVSYETIYFYADNSFIHAEFVLRYHFSLNCVSCTFTDHTRKVGHGGRGGGIDHINMKLRQLLTIFKA